LAGTAATSPTASLRQATDYYRKFADQYDATTQRVETILHLAELRSAEFWNSVLTARSAAAAIRLLVPMYSRILFASNHLPQLTEIARHGWQVAVGHDAESSALQRELCVGFAAGQMLTTRDLTRVIDALNDAHDAFCRLNRMGGSQLEMMAFSGSGKQKLQFRAHRSIVAALSDLLAWLERENISDIDGLADMPILAALPDLAKLTGLPDSDVPQLHEDIRSAARVLFEHRLILHKQFSHAGSALESADQIDTGNQQAIESSLFDLIERERCALIAASEAGPDTAMQNGQRDNLQIDSPASLAGASSRPGSSHQRGRVDDLLAELTQSARPR